MDQSCTSRILAPPHCLHQHPALPLPPRFLIVFFQFQFQIAAILSPSEGTPNSRLSTAPWLTLRYDFLSPFLFSDWNSHLNDLILDSIPWPAIASFERFYLIVLRVCVFVVLSLRAMVSWRRRSRGSLIHGGGKVTSAPKILDGSGRISRVSYFFSLLYSILF